MNLDKLFEWIIVIVIDFALTGNLEKVTYLIFKAQTKLLYESLASAWGNSNIYFSIINNIYLREVEARYYFF